MPNFFREEEELDPTYNMDFDKAGILEGCDRDRRHDEECFCPVGEEFYRNGKHE